MGRGAQGSSPLTRGKQGRGPRGCGRSGLIPAHAGKTPVTRRAGTSTTAHPRSRGENGIPAAPPPTRTGSSPLTRGKRCSTRRTSPRVGLIPAHAGKTSRALSALGSLGAHPRSRGENMPTAPIVSVFPGSSPLTRGKHLAQLAGHFRPGLIPAHAGKTYSRSKLDTRRPAHPRSRGENNVATWMSGTLQGSSPLTRGKRPHGRARSPRAGLIPAHAGKTLCAAASVRLTRAHPRSRGENRPRHADQAQRQGLIPAHAGKTFNRPFRDSHVRAHPRSRGENTKQGSG